MRPANAPRYCGARRGAHWPLRGALAHCGAHCAARPPAFRRPRPHCGSLLWPRREKSSARRPALASNAPERHLRARATRSSGPNRRAPAGVNSRSSRFSKCRVANATTCLRARSPAFSATSECARRAPASARAISSPPSTRARCRSSWTCFLMQAVNARAREVVLALRVAYTAVRSLLLRGAPALPQVVGLCGLLGSALREE